MIIDEVDVFFSSEFFGKMYSPATSIRAPDIEALANYIWNNRDKITLASAQASTEYKNCLAKFKKFPKLL